MKAFIIFILCITSPFAIFAQTLNYEWVKQGSGSYTEHFNDVTTDNNGDIISVGTFWSSSLTLDNITLIKPDSTTAAMFVAKYDPNGNILWAKMAKTLSYGEETYGYSIATDANNDIYISGDLWGDTVIFDNDTIALPTSYGNAGFIVKYSANGSFSWVRMAYAARGTQSVAVDGNGDVYFTGIAAIEFEGSLISPLGGVFLAKYDNSGNFVWANRTQHSSATYGFNNEWMSNDVHTDNNNNVYITGWSGSDTIFFNASKTIYVANNPSLRNLFLAKYTPSGNPLWARGATRPINPGISASISGNSIKAIDNQICLVGDIVGDSISFGNNYISSFSSQDIFVAKFDLSGNNIWEKTIGSDGNDWGNGVTADSSGIYVGGTVEGYSLHDNFNIIDNVDGGNKAIVFQLDANGNFIDYQKPLNIPFYGTSYTHNIAIDNNSNIYMAGKFYNSVCFGIDTIQSATIWQDAFVAKLHYTFTNLDEITADCSVVKLFPNPAKDYITINLDNCNVESKINIYNTLGVLLKSEIVYSNQSTIYLDNLPTGAYLVAIQSDKTTMTQKIIIQR